MKILLISDLHSSPSTLKGLDELLAIEQFDYVLSPGDVTDRYDANALEYLDQFINLVTQKHGLKLKMVYGNNDSKEVVEHTRARGALLHFDEENIQGYRIAGIGDVESQGEIPGGTLKDLSGTIVVSHRPTPQFKALKASGATLSNAPIIQIFGHYHTRAETEQVGSTLIINVPAAMDGRYAVLELPSKKVEFKWFKNS